MTIEEVLERGVEEVIPSKKSLASLMKRRKITLYQGFDPSSPNLHIGHLIGVRKLAQFQALGHKVIFLIGDFTGMIGDPTDKSATRVKLTHKQVLKNAKTYKKQIEKILKFTGSNAAEIRFNADWLSILSFADIVELASNFTVQQLLERDFFQKRLENEKPIHLHEFLYPLMQGYDSVVMDVDLEIGGNDQLFNMMAGRSLMKSLKKKEKFVLTTKLLTDPTGKKMGKTEGNTINLTDPPEEIFGKVMALPDTLIKLATELATDLPLSQIPPNPLKAKKALALEIVSQIHSPKEAKTAETYFKRTFQKRKPKYEEKIEPKEDLLATIAQVTKSNSQAKRLIKEGAVDINEKRIKNPQAKVKKGDRIKIGKKNFFKVA